MCNTLPLHLPPHHTIPPRFPLRHSFIPHHTRTISDIDSKPHHIPHHTIVPHRIAHFISHQHLPQHTIPLCSTIFQIAWPLISATLYIYITPHLALHPVLHYVPRNATFQIAPYMLATLSHHHVSHHTTLILHNIVAPHSASCIIASFHHI